MNHGLEIKQLLQFRKLNIPYLNTQYAKIIIAAMIIIDISPSPYSVAIMSWVAVVW